MSKHHQVEGIIDPKYGNWVRITVTGEDLEEVLKTFGEQARLIASHTEEELIKMNKKEPSLFRDEYTEKAIRLVEER